MKLKELMEVFEYSRMELHSGFDGKLIASSKKSLEKFGDVEVLNAYPYIRVGDSKDYAHAYIYVFGNTNDIERIRQESKNG